MTMNYIEAIGLGFPGVQCNVLGDGTDYDTIEWHSGNALPSKAELDAYIAGNPTTDFSKLADGTPTFYYVPGNCYVSVNRTMVQFCTRANSKNYYLDYGSITSSATTGYIAHSHEIITSLSFSLAKVASHDVTARLRVGSTELGAAVVLAGSSSTLLKDLSISVNELDIVSCFVESQSSFSNPNLVFEVHRKLL